MSSRLVHPKQTLSYLINPNNSPNLSQTVSHRTALPDPGTTPSPARASHPPDRTAFPVTPKNTDGNSTASEKKRAAAAEDYDHDDKKRKTGLSSPPPFAKQDNLKRMDSSGVSISFHFHFPSGGLHRVHVSIVTPEAGFASSLGQPEGYVSGHVNGKSTPARSNAIIRDRGVCTSSVTEPSLALHNVVNHQDTCAVGNLHEYVERSDIAPHTFMRPHLAHHHVPELMQSGSVEQDLEASRSSFSAPADYEDAYSLCNETHAHVSSSTSLTSAPTNCSSANQAPTSHDSMSQWLSNSRSPFSLFEDASGCPTLPVRTPAGTPGPALDKENAVLRRSDWPGGLFTDGSDVEAREQMSPEGEGRSVAELELDALDALMDLRYYNLG